MRSSMISLLLAALLCACSLPSISAAGGRHLSAVKDTDIKKDDKFDCPAVKDVEEELHVECNCHCPVYGKGYDGYGYPDDCKEDYDEEDYRIVKLGLPGFPDKKDKDDKKDFDKDDMKDFDKDDKKDFVKDDKKECPISKRITKVHCDCKCPKVMKGNCKKYHKHDDKNDDNKKDDKEYYGKKDGKKGYSKNDDKKDA